MLPRFVLTLVLVFVVLGCGTISSQSPPTVNKSLLQEDGIDLHFKEVENFPLLYGEDQESRTAMDTFVEAYKHHGDLPASFVNGQKKRAEISPAEAAEANYSYDLLWESYNTGKTVWIDGTGWRWGLECGSKNDFPENPDNWFWEIARACERKINANSRGWFFTTFDQQHTCAVCL